MSSTWNSQIQSKGYSIKNDFLSVMSPLYFRKSHCFSNRIAIKSYLFSNPINIIPGSLT